MEVNTDPRSNATRRKRKKKNRNKKNNKKKWTKRVNNPGLYYNDSNYNYTGNERSIDRPKSVQHCTGNAGLGLCGDEGLYMDTRDLRCSLTQPYTSTFRAFTAAVRLWSPGEKVVACVLNDVCISVNCIMANQLMFSIEQHVFIYDQYSLAQSAIQIRRWEISMHEIKRVFHDIITGREWHPAISISGVDWKIDVYRTNPRTLEELKRNIRDEINNINRGELQRVMWNFIKRCQNVWTTKIDSSSTSVNKVGKYDNL